jgi:hypothetical protein
LGVLSLSCYDLVKRDPDINAFFLSCYCCWLPNSILFLLISVLVIFLFPFCPSCYTYGGTFTAASYRPCHGVNMYPGLSIACPQLCHLCHSMYPTSHTTVTSSFQKLGSQPPASQRRTLSLRLYLMLTVTWSEQPPSEPFASCSCMSRRHSIALSTTLLLCNPIYYKSGYI